ncbi:MAG: Flp family type IVb pilin [Candidatus Eisenbacteria bacterium]|nr:Flp family type IVb pilin [Candidatus Eisenbacteria bacterium]
MNTLKRMLRGQSGASTTEYALLLALVAIAVIGVIILFREELARTFMTIADALRGADGAAGSSPGGTHARPIGG